MIPLYWFRAGQWQEPLLCLSIRRRGEYTKKGSVTLKRAESQSFLQKQLQKRELLLNVQQGKGAERHIKSKGPCQPTNGHYQPSKEKHQIQQRSQTTYQAPHPSIKRGTALTLTQRCVWAAKLS